MKISAVRLCQPIKEIPPFRGIRKDVKNEETTIVMPTIVRDLFKRSECGRTN